MASAQDHTTTGRAAGGGTVPWSDTGAGLWGMAFGLMAFFVMLLFAVHFMLYLQLQTVAADAATVGANKIAGEGALADPVAADAHASEQAGRLLGGMFDDAWIGPADKSKPDDPGYVTFTVQTKPYSFARGTWMSGPVVRSARVRIERLR
jgi:hypothetical protein